MVLIHFLSKMVAQFIEKVSGVQMCMWLNISIVQVYFQENAE